MESLLIAGMLESFSMSVELFLYAFHFYIWRRIRTPYSNYLSWLFLSLAIFALSNLMYGYIALSDGSWYSPLAQAAGLVQTLGVAGAALSIAVFLARL